MAGTTKNLKELQTGTLFLFPAQFEQSEIDKDKSPNLANIYHVLTNYDSVVVYAKPGFPDVHYLGHHECPEVLLFAMNGRPTVSGLDLISPDEVGLLRARLRFHAYYRDFFARTFNQLPGEGYETDRPEVNRSLELANMRASCQSLCQYHIWRYNQIKAVVEHLDTDGIYQYEIKEVLK